MNLNYIVENSEYFTDETTEDVNYLSVANKALSIINIECKTLFPHFTDVSTAYTYLPKNWLFSLISPYISYAIKMNDSSLSEADRYLEEFYRALNNFKDMLGTLVDTYDGENPESGVSPDLVSDTGFGGVYLINTEDNMNIGFFGRNGNSGSW